MFEVGCDIDTSYSTSNCQDVPIRGKIYYFQFPVLARDTSSGPERNLRIPLIALEF